MLHIPWISANTVTCSEALHADVCLVICTCSEADGDYRLLRACNLSHGLSVLFGFVYDLSGAAGICVSV